MKITALLIIVIVLSAFVVSVGIHPTQQGIPWFYRTAYAFDPTLAELQEGINITWQKATLANSTIIRVAQNAHNGL